MRTLTFTFIIICTLARISGDPFKNKQFDSNPGIYFEALGKVYLSMDKWKLVTKIDLKQLTLQRPTITGMKIEELNQKCPDIIDLTDCRLYIQLSLYQRLDKEIQDNLDLLHQLLKMENSTLIHTSEEILDKHLKEFTVLETAPWSTTIDVGNNTHIINSEFSKTQPILNQHIINYSQKEGLIWNMTERVTKKHYSYSQYIEHIQEWNNHIQLCFEEYLTFIRNIVMAVNSALLGQFSPHILQFSTISKTVENFAILNTQYKLPLESRDIYTGDIYKISKFTYELYKQQLLLTLHVPLVSRNEFELYGINSVPVYEEVADTMKISAFIQPKTDYLIISSNRQLYSPIDKDQLEQCKFMNKIYICTPSIVFYDSNIQSSCEADLLMRKATASLSNCDIRISKNLNNFWQPLKGNNGWLYSLPAPTLIDIIHGSSTQYITLNGFGILNLQTKYYARIKGLNLAGTQNLEVPNDRYFVPNKNLNVTQLLPTIREYEPLFSNNHIEISLPTKILTYKYQLSQIKEELETNNNHLSSYLNYLVHSLLIVILIISLYCLVKFKYFSRTTSNDPTYRKCEGDELQLVSNMNISFQSPLSESSI